VGADNVVHEPVGVVVVEVDGEDSFQVAPVDDQRLVEQFPAEGADPPLRDRVRPRSPHRVSTAPEN
jgi:hypothetical protein